MKILLTGSNGFVGRKLKTCFPDVVEAPSLRDVSRGEIARLVETSGCDAIIHTAAISDTRFCQEHPEASYRANVELPTWLAQAGQGRKLIVFSSDQVYNAAEAPGPYGEWEAAPGSVYGVHKLEMEQRVLSACPEAVALRAQWMYDYTAPRANYLLNVLQGESPLHFSKQQYRGLCYLREVADNFPRVLELPGGVYNFGSETAASMYDITAALLTHIGSTRILQDSPGGHNLWMDCTKAKGYGIVFSDVLSGLKACIRDYEI